MKMSKSEAGKLGSIASRQRHEAKLAARISQYELNPTRCLNSSCRSALPYKQRKNKFCSHSCAAKHNNRQSLHKRDYHTFTCKGCAETKTVFQIQLPVFCDKTCELKYRKSLRAKKVTAGLASSASVKAYLIELHGNACLDPNCAWDFSKRPINVELEHIDGNSENNSLENCTLLCPNCHSQTPTYKSKNKGNGRHNRRLRYQTGKSY